MKGTRRGVSMHSAYLHSGLCQEALWLRSVQSCWTEPGRRERKRDCSTVIVLGREVPLGGVCEAEENSLTTVLRKEAASV